MLLPDTATRRADGTLAVGGCDLAALAEEYGTPLYVFDETTLRSRLRAYRDAVRGWPAGGDVLYSAKAYLSPAMVRVLVEEDCGIDVVSGGELEVALRSGMDPARIGFPGNNKEPAEIEAAVAARIGHLVIDSGRELDVLAGLPQPAHIQGLLRVSPGVKPDTHDFISTGQLDSKFGFGIETGQAMAALHRALEVPALELRGVHMHIGSQIFDLRSYPAALEIVAGFLAEARDTRGFVAAALSVGGGLGIAYTGSRRSASGGRPRSSTSSRAAASPGPRRWPSIGSARARRSRACERTSPSTAAWGTTSAPSCTVRATSPRPSATATPGRKRW